MGPQLAAEIPVLLGGAALRVAGQGLHMGGLGLACTHVSLRWPCRQVALQFPDELLADSAAVAAKMEEATGSKMYILGDTSYGR